MVKTISDCLDAASFAADAYVPVAQQSITNESESPMIFFIISFTSFPKDIGYIAHGVFEGKGSCSA